MARNTNTELRDSEELENRSGFLPLLVLLLVLIALILGGGYYFLQQPSGKALLSKIQTTLGMQEDSNMTLQDLGEALPSSKELSKDEEIQYLQGMLQQKERELRNLAQSVDGLNLSLRELQDAKKNTQQIQNTITKLRYSIKPKQKIIAECFSMEIGRWEIPQSCILSLVTKVGKELQEDKRVVAFEVQGIVDTNPYRGLSAELKQEGLASFRAWRAIRSINAKIPNATIFEGPSLQLANKRGYSIKAYFVE